MPQHAKHYLWGPANQSSGDTRVKIIGLLRHVSLHLVAQVLDGLVIYVMHGGRYDEFRFPSEGLQDDAKRGC